MNIFFCINNNYITQLAVTIISILENNKNSTISFYVLNSDIKESNKEKLQRLVKKYSSRIKFISIHDSRIKDVKLNINYISQESYYRFFIPEYCKEDKCLYLDADIIVNGSITSLFDYSFEKEYVAACRDLYMDKSSYKKTLNINKENIYFNAGVLLMNNNLLKKDNIVNVLFRNLEAYKKIIKFQDQDVLNITFKGCVKELDSVFNYTTTNLDQEKYKKRNAKIIHYTGKDKPWNAYHKCRLAYLWIYYLSLLDKDNFEIKYSKSILYLSKLKYILFKQKNKILFKLSERIFKL